MKRFSLILMLMFPVLVSARIVVNAYPLSPYFEPGQTNTFLVSIKNSGTNNIPIPPGLKMDNGIVIPTKDPMGSWSLIELTNGILNIYSSGGTGSDGSNIALLKLNLIEKALEASTKEEVWDQLHGKHFLKPQEAITYQSSWFCDPQYLYLKTHNPVMVSIFLDFYNYDIEVPPISLYPKPKSNQRVDPTVKTPVESGKAQGTAGHP